MDNQDTDGSSAGDDADMNTEEQVNNNQSQFTYPPSSIFTRRLKSFPPPNLVVLVGPNQHAFHYHAFMLASQSDYVDTLLSSPAAMKEREQMKISFPEVDVQVWEKMMKLLEPGGLTKTPMFADLLEVLPFYDKYQFSAGLRICDVILSDFLTVFLNPESRMWHTYRSADDAQFVKMVTMGHRLNLPQSKDLAVEYAGSRLKYILSCKEQVITDLLPLVENDAEILVAMVSTVLGKKSKDMTVDEMREFTRRNGFAEQCIGMHKQIQEIDRQMRQFGDIMTIRVQSQIEEFSGEYESLPASEFDPKYKRFLSRSVTSESTHCGGAMKYVWIKHSAGFRRHVIESVDVFGNEWQMSIIGYNEHPMQPVVAYKWGGIRSSIVPPHFGWVDASPEENDNPDVPRTFKIAYDYEAKRGFY